MWSLWCLSIRYMICLCRHADVQEDVLVAEIAVILRVVFFVSCVSKIASSSTTTRLPGRFTLRCIRLESSIIGSDREVSMTSPIHSSYPSLDRDHKSGKQTQDTRALSHTSFPSPAEHLRRVSREWIPVIFFLLSQQQWMSCNYPFIAFPVLSSPCWLFLLAVLVGYQRLIFRWQ